MLRASRTAVPMTISQAPASVVEELARVGFVRIAGVLSNAQVMALREEANQLLKGRYRSWNEFAEWASSERYEPCLFADAERDTCYFDILGQSRVVDAGVEAALSNDL